jgi:hypothetical protein
MISVKSSYGNHQVNAHEKREIQLNFRDTVMRGEAGQMRLGRDLSWATKVSLDKRALHPLGYETCASTRALEFAIR